MNLLPVRTGNESFPVQYRTIESLAAVRSGIAYVHDAVLYVLQQNNRNNYSLATQDGKAHINTINLFTGEMTKYAELDWVDDLDNINEYIGDMLVDDDYIYLSTSYGYPTVHIFQRRDVSAPGATMRLLKVGTFRRTYDNVNACGKMCFYDDQYILMTYSYGVLLFDKQRHVFIQKGGSSSYSIKDFANGENLIMMTNWSRSSTTIIGYRKSTGTYFTQSLPTIDVACVAYEDGKFYFANVNYLYVYDEATETVVETRNIPWAQPKNICIWNRTAYVISDNSARAYIHDMNSNTSQTFILAWTISTLSSSEITRSHVSEGFWFVAYESLMISDYSGYSKYNFGYKYESVAVMCNLANIQKFTYDPRFVTFTDTFMAIHDGDIEYELTPTDENPLIKSVSVSKNDYKFLNRIQFKSE